MPMHSKAMTLAAAALFVAALIPGASAQEAATPTPELITDVFDPAIAVATPIAGVETFEVASASHTGDPVDYPQDPPAGGPHFGSWQKCMVYDAPVQNEYAVHSQEHGAVWITYRPDLPDAEVKVLKRLAKDQPYVLVSPYPELGDTAVASAWGAQLRVDDVNDPRLQSFIARYAGNGPERGASCASGVEETLG